METKTVKLSKPIEVEGKSVLELTFRAATLGDLIAGEAVGKGARLAEIGATLASMCGVPYPIFKTISAGDFARINAATAALVGNGEPAGES